MPARTCATLALAAWAIGVIARAAEWIRWGRADGAWPSETPVAATHDAYTWLLAARDIGAQRDTGLGRLLRLASDCGASDAVLLLVVPVLLAPVAGALVTLIFVRAAGAHGALLAGITTNLSAAYLLRTRAGMLDTDPLALALPLVLVAVLAAWSSRVACNADCSAARLLAGGLAVGLLLRVIAATHASSLLPALGILLVAPIVASSRDGRPALVAMLVVASASWASPSWTTGAVAAAAIAPLAGRLLRAGTSLATLVAILGAGLLATPAVTSAASSMRLLERFGGAAVVLDADGRAFPSLHRFVAEAQPAEAWLALGPGIAPAVLCALGLAGLVGALARHPPLRLLVPLAILGAGGGVLGTRFLMYAAPAIGVGLGWLLARAPKGRRMLERIACASLCVAATAMLLRRPLTKVMSSAEAEAIRELSHGTEEDAIVWCSWELGYAVQYLSGRQVFMDGARTSGAELLPWARALGSSDARASSLRIRGLRDAPAFPATAREQVVLVGMRQAATSSWLCPWMAWDEAEPADCWIRFAGDDATFDGRRLNLAGASLPAGSLVDLTSEPAVVRHVADSGSVIVRRKGGWIAFSDALGSSLLVQLLVRDPDAFAPAFTCILDRGPLVRAFRVEAAAGQPRLSRLSARPGGADERRQGDGALVEGAREHAHRQVADPRQSMETLAVARSRACIPHPTCDGLRP